MSANRFTMFYRESRDDSGRLTHHYDWRADAQALPPGAIVVGFALAFTGEELLHRPGGNTPSEDAEYDRVLREARASLLDY